MVTGRNSRAGSETRISRRSLLRNSAVMGAVGASGVLSACTDDTDGSPDVSSASNGDTPGGLLPGFTPEFNDAVRAQLEGTTVRVGFSPPVLSEFFNQMEHAAFWAMNEIEQRFGVQWDWSKTAPTGDFETVQEHINIIENWVENDFDVILMCTGADFGAMRDRYQQAIESGTKVYEFNMPNELWPLEDQTHISSITYNNVRQSGYLAGNYIAERLEGDARILLIWGPAGHWAKARMQGLEQAVDENPGLEIVDIADGGYVRDKGFEAAENLLQEHADVDAVYGENEEMALGASQAIDTLGREHWDPESGQGILTIGADGLATGFKAIRENRLTGTIYVGTNEQGVGLINTIFYNHLLGMSVDRIQNQPTAVVDERNVDIFAAYTEWALNPPETY